MNFFMNLLFRLKNSIVLRKYNDFTIEKYFREKGARVGHNNRLQIRFLSQEPYLITIGNHCTIVHGVTFLTHDGAGWVFTEEDPSIQKFGSITIYDNCFIGFSAIIIGEVVIGPNSIVGAGAVVAKDVPPNTVVAGNPARVICSVGQYKEKIFKIWENQKPKHYLSSDRGFDMSTPETIQRAKREDMPLLEEYLLKLYRDR